MGTRYALVIALLSGFGMGAVAGESLHAQSKPPLYNVTEVDVKDPAAFAAEYVPRVQATIKRDGGHYVALGGSAGAGKVTGLDGPPPASRIAIITWDSIEQLQAHRETADYKEARKVGEKYATFRSYTVDGIAN